MANPVCEVLLTEKELELAANRAGISAGAIVDFHGVVRAIEAGCEISGIDYEAHRPMAQHQLSVIGKEAAGKFALERVIIHHRLGFVPAGQSSLLLRVAARHRAEAFQASQWIVDELKKKAPIWKQPKLKVEAEAPERNAEMQRRLA
jgi:molybdopterin synthase catalytic subunit